MDDLYVPELNIQMLEKDIKDAIYELRNNARKISSSVDSLITTTDLLKSNWKTNEGIVVTDEVKRLLSSLDVVVKNTITDCNNIPVNINYKTN